MSSQKVSQPIDGAIVTYADFWNWFQQNEKKFFEIVKERGAVKEDFFEKLLLKLSQLRESIFLVAGMEDENTIQLVFTADGVIKHLVFVENLVAAAPAINGWKFIALKPALEKAEIPVRIGGYDFNYNNLHFYANDHDGYPDEIDITVVHDDLNEENQLLVNRGSYTFLDNLLGELAFVETIDNLRFISKEAAEKELIPIEKLKGFLNWRQKEFIEKYDDIRYNTENEKHKVFEGKTSKGKLIAVTINLALMEWDSKTSHPWILMVIIPYDGTGNNGMPDEKASSFLDTVEKQMLTELKDLDGYLNVCRKTSDNKREVYFACKDFRKPTIVMDKIVKEYANETEIGYDLFKDKYWQSFIRFLPAL